MADKLPEQKTSELKNKYSQFTEHVLAKDEFNNPKVLNGPNAIVQKILNLILLRPGTYPTRPYMGVGLIENFRYTFTDEIDKLEAEINEQIRTYLPEFESVNVNLDTTMEKNKVLLINIIVDSSVYTISLDSDKKTLDWVIHGD
jgi:hypothetical protein